jgi:hypothetical protein
MHRNTHTRALHTIKPAHRAGGTLPVASLEELAASILVSPDDVSLEIEDLAPHFLYEATQSSMPSSAPPPSTPIAAQGPDAALREAFFEESQSEREKLREFERIWKHIISRELISTEL